MSFRFCFTRNSACGEPRGPGFVRRGRRGCRRRLCLKRAFLVCRVVGSVYPLTGNNGATGDLPAVYALSAVKLLAKLHNELLAFKTTGEEALCAARPHRVIVKDQYKLQLAFPKNTQAFPIGRTTARWAPGKWYPGQGEDWVWVLWRKKTAACSDRGGAYHIRGDRLARGRALFNPGSEDRTR